MRTVIQEDFKTALQEVDLLLSLVAPTAADKTGTAPFCSIFTLQLRHMHLAENLLLSIIPKIRNSGQYMLRASSDHHAKR
jgi:Asp-tRNA(Asn)/Glu-tRNA(Gln) amidotransferase A subunit family amidase